MEENHIQLATIISIHPVVGDQKPASLWDVPLRETGYIEIRDEYWSGKFGSCQTKLSQITTPHIIEVDFSTVCWIDPLPLLSIFIAIKTCCARTQSRLRLLLGVEPQPGDIMVRGGFLKFVSQHGFLSALSGVTAEIVLGYITCSPDSEEMESLREKLSSSKYIMAFPDSLCLEAKIEPVSMFQREDEVSAIVHEWVETLKESRIQNHFEGESDIFREFIDKVNILLVEMLLNAGEHAYADNEDLSMCYCGVYARLRAPNRQDRKLWLKKKKYISDEKDCCPGFKNLDLDYKNSTWLEIFYVDQGRGILADLETWVQKATGDLKQRLSQLLSKMKPSTNKLHEIGKVLFKEPLSRYDRHNQKDRTILTGLQYARHALTDREDRIAIYTDGEWLSARMPWSPETLEDSTNLRKQSKYQSAEDGRVYFSDGTAWQFYLDLDIDVLSINDDEKMSGWYQVAGTDVDTTVQGETAYKDWQIFDDRDLGYGVRSRSWNNEEFFITPSLWLPAIVRKNLIHQWATAIFNYRCEQNHEKEWVWIIADVSRKDALLLNTVISSLEHRGERNKIFLCIVTRDWLIKCHKSITSINAGRSFKEDAKIFLKEKTKNSSVIYNILRKHDSKIFWNGLTVPNADKRESAYIPEEIIWQRNVDSNQPSVVLNGYLDLTQALLDPEKLAVARRALERTWHLHAKNAECVAADPLLSNLLPREARLRLNKFQDTKIKGERQQVVVGSVYVTGTTTERAQKEGQSTIHLLRHTQVQGKAIPHVSSDYALNWIGSVTTIKWPANHLQYERIPGTPYISRGGAKAAPIRRFDFNDESFYEKNPQETYDELINCGLLKLGHWVYGPHHDLLSLNLGDCVGRKKFYKKTAVEWIIRELTSIYANGTLDVIIVYSSHPVTDKLVTALKSLLSERGTLLPVFTPVHFLAPHVQTAIRMPSLTYERIRGKFKNAEDKKTKKPVIVLLDDGTVTGKVQREMEQLLLNAGADKVIHWGLVTRTGLPLYRKYLSKSYNKTHRYYCRWDVPPLGNARSCPLCRAIDQARELAQHMWIEDAAKEVNKWIKQWEASSVTTHWSRHGLNPENLPETRSVTFGKEWAPGKEPVKYELTHSTSTGLAATVLEIIRTTSYNEVGLKLARAPWPDGNNYQGDKEKWRSTKLEILVCQLLIYFDDFTDYELQERFKLLLEVMLEPEFSDSNLERTYQMEQLGCLSLLLAAERHVKYCTKELWKLFKNMKPGVHLLLLVGILMRRAGNFKEQLDLIPKEEMEIRSLLSTAHFYGQGEEVRGTRHALFSLVLLLGEDNIRHHTGFLRKKLTRQIDATTQDILRDLKTLEQTLREIDPNVMIGKTSPFDPKKEAKKLRKYIGQIKIKNENEAIPEELRSWIINELSLSVQNNFIITAEDLKMFLARTLTKDDWNKKVNSDPDQFHVRWKDGDTVIQPIIDVSVKDITNPSETFALFPPIAKSMVRDHLFNVIHSSRKIDQDNLNCDMQCSVSIQGKDILLITMWNYVDQDKSPKKKAAEGVVSLQLIRDPVSYEHSGGKFFVRIQLPLVEHLYRGEK